MRLRGNARPRAGFRISAVGACCALCLAAAGCGSDDFENEPRPPSPIELTAAIDDDSVSIAPSDPGAGLVNVTVSNQSDETTSLVLEGPTSASSNDIPPGGTGTIKASLEQGDYEAMAGAEIDIKPAKLKVGPPRDTSQNELLLP